MSLKGDEIRSTDQSASSIDLSIIIVNFNTRDLLVDCLHSIYAETKHTNFEIILVDNASTDGSVTLIYDKFPEVKLIKNTSNIGFSRANNIAIKRARGRYILLLNPDTVILDEAIDRMVAFMERHRKVGITGAKMYNALMRPWRYDTRFLNPVRYLAQPLVLRLWGDIGNKMVDWVCGACLLIRRSVIEKIGLLDNYMFGEDVDWCYRAKQAGWLVFHLGEARIIHYWGAASTVAERIAWRTFTGRQSKLYYARKHSGRRGFVFFLLAVGLEILIKMPLLFLLISYSRPERRERWHGQLIGFHRLLRSIISGTILSDEKS